jgi:HD-GYP domain-containing protein (c-di-GMP phosphodiesterase class II)
MLDSDGVPRSEVILALSMVGDLSMGQSINQSRRTARLAHLLAQACHGKGDHSLAASQVSLLRWSGCTANAEGFAHLLGNDVQGRNAMLSHTLDEHSMQEVQRSAPLAQVHCEVAGGIAETLGLSDAVQLGLRHVFEEFNGQGRPLGLKHPEVPEVVYNVVLAGDLEILSRVHGLDAALAWIAAQRDVRYPAAMADLLVQNARDWLAAVGQPGEELVLDVENQARVPLTLVTDVVELKLPWLSGYSRKAALIVAEAGKLWGLPQKLVVLTRQAALIHGIGRAAVSNRIWNTPGPLSEGDFEQVRLAPYWTSRVTSQIPGLTDAGAIAAHAYERCDGSGYFHGLSGLALRAEHRLLAVALAWQAMCSDRPWRRALNQSEAANLLMQEAGKGRFDAQCCEVVIAAARGGVNSTSSRASKGLLSEREAQVLKCISTGASNKEAARLLGISPSTVRTHVESVFQKLECTTRAAATLKALTLGLI